MIDYSLKSNNLNRFKTRKFYTRSDLLCTWKHFLSLLQYQDHRQSQSGKITLKIFLLGGNPDELILHTMIAGYALKVVSIVRDDQAKLWFAFKLTGLWLAAIAIISTSCC